MGALAQHDYSLGCAPCGAEVAAEGREGSYPASFDSWPRSDGTWPTLLDFNLSTSCNLQCIQCNGEQSSAIRIHRERRQPLAPSYDDRFFEDIRAFLPHALEARFAGGEPFMASENYRVWAAVAEVAPDLPCMVITNATQWNPRVEAAARSVRMGFVFSIDGITAATYEAIRLGASFERVMENVGHLRAVAADNGMPATVNHCLMVQNHHEFADLLLWAEEAGMAVQVSVVRDPDACAIARQPGGRIREIAAVLEARDAEAREHLSINLATWTTELARVQRWAQLDDDARREVWGISHRSVLMFKAEGTGPTDDRQARLELEAFAPGRVVALTAGDDESYLGATGPISEVFGIDPAEVAGLATTELYALLEARCGEATEYRMVSDDEDRADVTFRLGGRACRAIMLALRDERGWADRARVLLAMAP